MTILTTLWNIWSDFTVPLFIYVAVGTTLLWSKTSKKNRKIYGLSDILGQVLTNDRAKSMMELIVFLTLGCLISKAFVVPTTEAQALAAGLGWTGLCTTK
jgi:hypothetical protein